MITALNLVHIPKTAGSSVHIQLTEKTLKHSGAFVDLFDLMTIRVSGKEPKTVAERERFEKLRQPLHTIPSSQRSLLSSCIVSKAGLPKARHCAFQSIGEILYR